MVTGYVTQNWTDFTAGTWRQEPSLSGGGQAYDTGAHLLNSLCWSVESDVSEVFAYLDNHGTKVDVNSVINVRFVNGVLASMAVSGNCSSVGSDAAFIFEGGRVEIDGWSGRWIRIYDGNGQQKYPLITGQPQTPDDNFIDAIMGRAEPRTTPQNGIVQSQLMDCIYESAKDRKTGQTKGALIIVNFGALCRRAYDQVWESFQSHQSRLAVPPRISALSSSDSQGSSRR